MDSAVYTLIAPLIAIIGLPLLIYATRVHKDYEEKAIKIQTSLLGRIISAKDELVRNELKNGNNNEKVNQKNAQISIQEEEYKNFIHFMKDSNFLGYINEYEFMLGCPEKIEKCLKGISISIVAYIIPLVIYNYLTILFDIVFFLVYIPSTVLVILFFAYLRITRKINDDYKEYVQSEKSFGGYYL